MMATMFLDETSGKWIALAVLTVVSVALIAGSRHQPFPEISGRFGWVLATITGLLAWSEAAPRPMSLTLLLMVVLAHCRGIQWVIETPMASLISHVSRFQYVLEHIGAWKLSLDLVHYGSETKKPLTCPVSHVGVETCTWYLP